AERSRIWAKAKKCKREQKASLLALCRAQPNLGEGKKVQARAEGKFTCIMPSAAEFGRSSMGQFVGEVTQIDP
ncbi:MAG: hypothetical protein IKA35_02655, partial [Bacteroidaceae bacterium]|nr:hypothetical protein [Bacteroidaceae bacterium]